MPELLALDLIDNLTHQNIIRSENIGDLILPGAGLTVDPDRPGKHLFNPWFAPDMSETCDMADLWNIEALIGHGDGYQNIDSAGLKILDPPYSLLAFVACG